MKARAPLQRSPSTVPDPAPAAKSPKRARGRRRDFLADITIDFGPRELLARFFPKAVEQIRAQGLTLSFVSMDELTAINARNSDSWRPLLPIFDPAHGVGTEDSYCIVARNGQGDAVATTAGRLFSWSKTTFKAEAESLRLLYAEPERHRGSDETIAVTAPKASTISGRVVFNGAAWNRRDYRGGSLSAILPRIGRTYALTRWSSDHIMSIMAEDVYRGGVAERAGYKDVEWALLLNRTPVWRGGTIRTAVISMDTKHQLADLGQFLTGLDAVVDPVVQFGAA
jgi:hypothetical protein